MEEQVSKSGGRRPPLVAWSIQEREGYDRPFWHKVGGAWVNRDGSITIQFDSLPLGGKVQLREEKERDRADGQRAAGGALAS